jgi:hypothetical protein
MNTSLGTFGQFFITKRWKKLAKYTVFLLINAPGRLFFDHFFWKNCLTKMSLTPIFHFFLPYKGLRGAFIRRNTRCYFTIYHFQSLSLTGWRLVPSKEISCLQPVLVVSDNEGVFWKKKCCTHLLSTLSGQETQSTFASSSIWTLVGDTPNCTLEIKLHIW